MCCITEKEGIKKQCFAKKLYEAVTRTWALVQWSQQSPPTYVFYGKCMVQLKETSLTNAIYWLLKIIWDNYMFSQLQNKGEKSSTTVLKTIKGNCKWTLRHKVTRTHDRRFLSLTHTHLLSIFPWHHRECDIPPRCGESHRWAVVSKCQGGIKGGKQLQATFVLVYDSVITCKLP